MVKASSFLMVMSISLSGSIFGSASADEFQLSCQTLHDYNSTKRIHRTPSILWAAGLQPITFPASLRG